MLKSQRSLDVVGDITQARLVIGLTVNTEFEGSVFDSVGGHVFLRQTKVVFFRMIKDLSLALGFRPNGV